MEGICPVLQQQPKALRVAQTGGDQERCIPVLVHQVDISGCVAVIGLVQAVGQGLAIILSHVHEYICNWHLESITIMDQISIHHLPAILEERQTLGTQEYFNWNGI